MATLILATVGRFLGGPIGGAIGATIGNIIDRDVLFKPAGREGPRLTELQLQTSSYGTPLQKVFGTMRIGGCIIWSTDLIESKATSGGGKGQPSTTNYSYSASFAVALSGRPVAGVGRIWADGKLLRGAGGDFKSATGFRLHLGGEDQGVDPLIASAEGSGQASAHRGIAYAVFEHFQLADYGNRIPSLTFEVIGDAVPLAIGTIAEEVSDGAIIGEAAMQALAGFSAYGDSVRGVAETLAIAGGAWFAPSSQHVRMRADVTPEREIADGETKAASGSTGKHGRAIAALETVPRDVTLAHYDPARDYQTGLQRARRPGAGARADRIEMPAAITAGAAKTMAEAVLSRAEAGRERRTVTLGWDALAVTPGACVTIAGVPGIWRVSAWALEHMVLSLECVRLAAGTLPLTASAGRVLPAPDVPTGTTVLAAFEGLPIDDSVLTAPRVTILAAGTQPGWRRAAVLYSTDDGAHWDSAGSTASAATLGTLIGVPDACPAAIVDRASHFVVALSHGDMALVGADAEALDRGANLAVVGDELLQFGTAEQIDATRWRLSGLIRGRRATESAIGTQNVGDRFVLIEAESVLSLDLPLSALGRTVRVMASGSGDTVGPVEVSLTLSGRSVLPPAPVHLAYAEAGSGDVAVQWVRRSRNGWRWSDGVDVPLIEEREAYRIQVIGPGGATTTIEADRPEVTIAAAERVGEVTLTVRQVGAHGESAGTSIAIPAWIG